MCIPACLLEICELDHLIVIARGGNKQQQRRRSGGLVKEEGERAKPLIVFAKAVANCNFSCRLLTSE